MSLRALIGGTLLFLLALASPAPAQTVTIESGRIEGVTLASGVRAWFGVPFAAPPLRELRWKPPQPARGWAGIYHADRTAPMCLQTLRGRTMNHYFGNEATSEDCLYLNVWAPGAPAESAYPVLVWIYGGGFTVGSASMANYSGEHIARKGVAQVNIAYRLGALGFLSHPELSRESAGNSGNYGLMDQISALQWVQRNIAAFGGDPTKVTIAGQSAGSMSVALLQASPMARGLFRAAVGMSGSPFTSMLAPAPLAQAEADGLNLQRALAAENIEAMRDLPADRVVAASFPRGSPITIDGRVVTEAPAAMFAAHRQNDVPIMIGFTRDESLLSLGAIATGADYEAAVRRMFPTKAPAILRAYPVRTDAGAAAQARRIGRDASLGRMTDSWATAQRQFGRSPAYVWLFTRRQPYAPDITFVDHDPATVGAYHTGDVPYWLQTLDSLNLFRQTRDWTPMDRQLAESMSDMLVSFVKTGRPSREWPAHDPQRPRMIQLGEVTRVIDWPHHAALPLLSQAQSPVAPPAARRTRD